MQVIDYFPQILVFNAALWQIKYQMICNTQNYLNISLSSKTLSVLTCLSQYACLSFFNCVVFLILKCTSVLSCKNKECDEILFAKNVIKLLILKTRATILPPNAVNTSNTEMLAKIPSLSRIIRTSNDKPS